MEMRLQKLLSERGITSRRGTEKYILAGRVTVNGVPAALGDRADPERDRIEVDGKPLPALEQRTYLMLNKPRGYVTILSDEQGRRDVSALMAGCGARVWPVGRLDLDSEGLLLMTDDGPLTNFLTHPGHEVEKEYRVWVKGYAPEALAVLRGPLELDGVPLRPADVELLERAGEEAVLSVVIREGKNRQVRRMCAIARLSVTRLQRVREGAVLLGDLAPGRWRALTEEEVRLLKGG